MLLLGGCMLTLIAPWVNIQFLGSSLTFMMVYVWGRRHQVRAAPTCMCACMQSEKQKCCLHQESAIINPPRQ